MYGSRRAAATLLGLLVLAGCSHSGTTSTATPGGTAGGGAGSPTGAASPPGTADRACTGGLKGTEPGVVRITCDGTATIRVQAGGVSKDFHGGACRSAGDVWSAAAGVVIDITGTHGAYTGPPVDSVAVNNTSTAGKGTIQLVLGGKHYFDLGTAPMTLAAGGKSAHLDGTSDHLSDAPGAKVTVDVTC
jgi:hypothetical protein